MKEVTITKNEFIDLMAKATDELSRKNDNGLSVVLSGAVVSCELTEELFGSEESKTFTREQFLNLSSSAIRKMTSKEDLKEIGTSLGIMAIMLIATIRKELFKEEENN